MELRRIFPTIYYDLSQNIIKGEAIRLDYQSLVLCIGHVLKHPSIIEDFKIIVCPEMGDESLFDCDYDVEDSVIPKVFTLITQLLGDSIDTQIVNVTTAIRKVMDEVVLFLRKMNFSSLEDLCMFAKNFVITSQGTINTKKTVIRVLERENLSNLKKFKLSAEFFLENFVIKYFYDLSDMELTSVFQNLDAVKDFSSYFWVWQIIKYRIRINSPKFFAYILTCDGNVKYVKADTNDYRAIQFLFIRAIENHNEMAVEYLWTKYISYIKESQVICRDYVFKYILIDKYYNTVMYLLLQIRKNKNGITFIRHTDSDIRLFLDIEPRFRWIRDKLIAYLEDIKPSNSVIDENFDFAKIFS